MFVAISIKDRGRITSIASQWNNRLEALRELTDTGQLICPGCEQLLWLRIGQKRRRHFAHRRLADCPLENQSAEVLEAKAQLYEWLESKYPGHVHLDMAIGVPGWVKPMDLLVEPEPDRKFGYWVFDRQQRSRFDLLAYQRLPGVNVHFIHTESTLTIKPETGMVLTASQREFITGSDFDRAVAWRDRGHLHFLLGGESKICIYRGLHCVHKPNVYQWAVERSRPLSEALISPRTGEIVFPEDVETRDEWQRQSAGKQADRHKNNPPGRAMAGETNKPSATEPMPATRTMNLNGPFRCEDCGIETLDWSVSTPSAGTCVCRACVKKRWQQNAAPQST